MSTPALYNIKTVTGLQDCLVLQINDSIGNVISGDSYSVRGAIALKGSTYELSVTADALGNYLLTWDNLPAGVWRFDVFVNDEPLLYGNTIVQGRVTPCVSENPQDLGQFLQVQRDQEGVVQITLSDVNSAKWYAEVAKGSADEAKNVLRDTENLSLDIERQIEAGNDEIQETTTSSVSSINSVWNTAVVNIYTAKEEALDDISQEVVKAQNFATNSANSATASANSATSAQASAETAHQAQTATEALAEELDSKYERAVFTDNAGNVAINGGLTVAGVANLNGGAVVPKIIEPLLTNALNLYSGMGLSCMSQLFESKVNFDNWMTHAGTVLVTSNNHISLKLSFNKKNVPAFVGRVFFTALSATQGIYGSATGVVIPLTQAINGGDKSGWIKLSFAQFMNYNTANFAKNYTLEDEDAFVIYPKGNTSSLIFDITYRVDSARTYYRTRYLKANTSFTSGLEMVEQKAVINFTSNSWGTQVRAYFIFGDTAQNLTYIFVLVGNTLCKIAEMPYISFYEQSHYRYIQVSVGGLGEGCYGDVAFSDQTGLNGITNINTGRYVAPWLDIAKAVSIDCVTERIEAVEFVPPVTEEASDE